MSPEWCSKRCADGRVNDDESAINGAFERRSVGLFPLSVPWVAYGALRGHPVRRQSLRYSRSSGSCVEDLMHSIENPALTSANSATLINRL